MNRLPDFTPGQVERVSGAYPLHLREVLERALREDLGYGDVSGELLDGEARGEFLAREAGVLSGSDAIGMAYDLLGGGVKVSMVLGDGDSFDSGDLLAVAEGPAALLLAGERVILNLLQHMSGISTVTARTVAELQESGVRLCDTRKTIPGLRALQKYAVRCGGGFNHRFRLDGGVMIKDNHIVAAGSITQAVGLARKRVGLMTVVEVECETIEEVREAVAAGADIIMIDNKLPEEARRFRDEIPGEIVLEVSGGITPETAAGYRDSGADYLSMGALTHSVRALDIGFDLSGGAQKKKAGSRLSEGNRDNQVQHN